ncbi:MAG TPA: S8 family serine peptidase [Bacteroidales bacterium]
MKIIWCHDSIVEYTIYIILCFFVAINSLRAQDVELYRVTFKDKAGQAYLLDSPNLFLSNKALQRRAKNNVKVDETDLPIKPAYIDSLTSKGIKIVNKSKWFNCVTVDLGKNNISEVEKISCVLETRIIRKKSTFTSKKYWKKLEDAADYTETSFAQVALVNGFSLHKLGYKGKGISIAVMDAGFGNADVYESLTNVRNDGRIVDVADFVYPRKNIYKCNTHGAMVLSIMAGEKDGVLYGTAPEATYYLFRTEDAESEWPCEEDNWVAAAECADSAGVDVINTSLGYTTFDDTGFDYSYNDLNGKVSRISQGATMSASKGIIVVASAGNEGNNAWKYIGVPADAEKVITVGAVDSTGFRAVFSSVGPTSDKRVKPDVAAMGAQVVVEVDVGVYKQGNGTSFSAPLISGMLACLIQAFPNFPVEKIKGALLLSASQYNSPDSAMGYGIPDFYKAYQILARENNANHVDFLVYPNPFSTLLNINTYFENTGITTLKCFNLYGQQMFSLQNEKDFIHLQGELQYLREGMYIFTIERNGQRRNFVGVKKR